jgi:hypothetical protein
MINAGDLGDRLGEGDRPDTWQEIINQFYFYISY